MDRQIEQFKAFVEESSNIIAVTGAGISFASGGLSFDHASPGEMQEMMVLDSEESLRKEPEHYYEVLDRAFLHSMFHIGPSKAHRALARLEQEGKIGGIITTNVDCLHTMAGSVNVAEIQGSLQVNRCCECGRHYDDYHIWSHGKVPECTECGGKIWPFPFYSHIGLYREQVKRARKWISKADLILIIGANGNYGGAYWSYRNRKARVVQINPGSTGFDSAATLNIRRDADSVFDELLGEENRQ